MRSTNKSRSRNKNNRSKNNQGNVVNRVFDSSGPEGKVRGTPQQIIDKYQALARDAQLSGDRVAHENFLQHSEHYARLLSEAQREMASRREQQNQRQQEQQKAADEKAETTEAVQPSDVAEPVAMTVEPTGGDLVDTPENSPQPEIG